MLKKILLFLFLFTSSFQISFGNEEFINDFNYILQNPSDIERQEESIYICDNKRDECRVNFKLIDLDEKDISSKYSCEIITDFNIGDNKSKCNPTTIIIPENSNQIIEFKIYDKLDENNFIEKEILINNTFKDSGEENLDFLSDFIIDFQNPSYIEETDIEGEYLCDEGEDECKVNFELLDEEENTLSNKYSCEIITDFDIGDNSDRCNPTTIIIPKNTEQTIKFKIYNENKTEFIEKEILIKNPLKEGEEVEFSDYFEINLQSPSYIKKTEEDGEYICDEEKEKCKINFELLTTSGQDIGDNYECEIITGFDIGTNKDRCNPTTIIIPENSEQIIKFKIYNKKDGSDFIEKEILIKNIFEKEEVIEDEPEIIEEENIDDSIPEFIYILQSPSYIEETDIKGEYLCDFDKDECKINFKLVTKEGEKDISSKYKCEIITDFDIGENKNKCNPGTIVIPENSEQIIKFRIYDKDKTKFLEKEILIKNIFQEKIIENDENLEEDEDEKESEIINKDDKNINNTIPEFTYILQSPSYARKVDQNNLECEADKDECKINFKLVTKEGEKDISSKYECEIITNFDIGTEKNKCNPSTITIPKDSDENIKFIVYDKNNKTIFRELEIFVDNTIIHYLSYTKIQVQGKITKYKKLGYKNITCLTYDKCSINFTASNYNSSTNYKWDFRNGERYYGYNPKTVKFSPGFYRVKLITTDDFGNRKVDLYKVTVKQLLKKFQQKEVKEGLKKILDYKKTAYNLLDEEINITKNINKTKKEIVKNLEIKNIKKSVNKNVTIKNIFGDGIKKVPVPKNKMLVIGTGTDNIDKIEKEKIKLLKKNIKYSVSFQKKSLKISGKTSADSRVEIKIGEKIFLTTSDNIGKYELKINTSLVAGKYKILISAFNKDGILVGEKYTSEKEITQKYISQLNNYKYKQYLSSIKKSKSKSKKKTTTKIKRFKVENIKNNTQYSSLIPVIKKEEEKFSIKIFAINILISILSFILMYMTLIRKKII